MADYTKYAEIKTEEILGYNNDTEADKPIEYRKVMVNKVLEKLLAEGYEIIDIKYDSIVAGIHNYRIYAVATIIYGKIKDTVKK